MHEFSIAQAIAQLAVSHQPAGTFVQSVRVRAGALRAIDPQAMQWAWESLRDAAGLSGALLHLALAPWTMRCSACGKQWESAEPLFSCACGSDLVRPSASDELILESIEVEDLKAVAATGGQHAGASH